MTGSDLDVGGYRINTTVPLNDQSPHGTTKYSRSASRLQKAASLDSRPVYTAVNIEPQRLHNYGANSPLIGPSLTSPLIGQISSSPTIGYHSPRMGISHSSHIIHTPPPGGGHFRISRSDHQGLLYENYQPISASSGSPRDSSPHSVHSTSSSHSGKSFSHHKLVSALVASRWVITVEK